MKLVKYHLTKLPQIFGKQHVNFREMIDQLRIKFIDIITLYNNNYIKIELDILTRPHISKKSSSFSTDMSSDWSITC